MLVSMVLVWYLLVYFISKKKVVGIIYCRIFLAGIKPLWVGTMGKMIDVQGIKYDSDKLPYSAIPVKPLEDLVDVYLIGAKKYGMNNWRKGIAWSRIFSAMQRHAWDWWGGEELDQEDRQHHLASVAWCAFTLLEYLRTHPELDDRIKNSVSNFNVDLEDEEHGEEENS